MVDDRKRFKRKIKLQEATAIQDNGDDILMAADMIRSVINDVAFLEFETVSEIRRIQNNILNEFSQIENLIVNSVENARVQTTLSNL